MSISLIDFLLIILVFALFIWIIHLKKRVEELEVEATSRAPNPETLSIHDLKNLQNSLTELVDEIETYSEEQMRRMGLQAEAIQAMSRRIDARLKELEKAIENDPAPTPQLSRMVPVTPHQYFSNLSEKERILELHDQGWSAEDIAKELRITKGEVQLIVNLI